MKSVLLPFPDESINSWLTRYEAVNGIKIKDSKKTSPWSSELTNLDSIINDWSEISGKDKASIRRKILYQHTFHRIEEFLCLDEAKDPKKRHRGIDVNICCQCIIDDIKKFGVAYIHRSHNFPGVDACHIHHQPLTDSCGGCGKYNFHHSYSKYYDCVKLIDDSALIKLASDVDVGYAIFVYKVLTSSNEPISQSLLREAILSRKAYLGLGLIGPRQLWCSDSFSNAYCHFQDSSSLDKWLRYNRNLVAPQKIAKITYAMFESSETYFNYLEFTRKNTEAETLPKAEDYSQEMQEADKLHLEFLLEEASELTITLFTRLNFKLIHRIRRRDFKWVYSKLNNNAKFFKSSDQLRVDDNDSREA